MQPKIDGTNYLDPGHALMGETPYERRFASSQAAWLATVMLGAGLLAILEPASWRIAGIAAAFAALPAALGLAILPKIGTEWAASLMCAVWLALAAAAVATTGGIASPFSFLLFVPIILAILLERAALARDAALIAGITLLACLIAEKLGLLGRAALTPGSSLAGPIGALSCLAYCVWLLVTSSKNRAEGRSVQPLPVSRSELPLQPANDRMDLVQKGDVTEPMTPRYLAELAHELKTPLNAIIGFADVMRQSVFGKLPEKYVEYADTIHDSGTHMLELVTNMLDASRIRAGGYSLNLETMDVHRVVTETAQMMRGVGRDAGVSILTPGTADPLMVRADKTALRQILTNLIVNGIKYTPAGGTVTVQTAVDNALVLKVVDTGVGIPQDALERVMRPFEQGPSAKVGAGLGLAVVHGLVELHGGQIDIQSPPGSGAVITVTLPVLIGPEG